MLPRGAAVPMAMGAGAPLVEGKVFGIGLNKTGTSSLRRALLTLKVAPVTSQKLIHRAGIVEALFERHDPEPALRYARAYRAFEDRPWNVWEMYRLLDERYPGSRFILTIRDEKSWWRSVQQWITVSKPWIAERYRAHLRAATLSEMDMLAGYRAYNGAVREYFAGRDDLLELDLERGQGWPELCPFLGVPQPRRVFPHVNRQLYDAGDRKPSRDRGPDTAKKVEVGTPAAPSVRVCAACGQVVTDRDRRERRWPALLPGWSKEAFRSLQRHWFRPRSPAGDGSGRPEVPPGSVDDMAVVCAFFNPCAYRSRVLNYRRFRRGILACGLPLLTVELAIGGDPFQLEVEPGWTLRLRSPDALWQKERLLNLGIRELLRRGFRRIVWLDADIAFDDLRGWPQRVAAELERSAVCQVLGQVAVEHDDRGGTYCGVSAVRYWREIGRLLHQDRRAPSWRLPFGYPLGHSGYGWAARAEVLEQVELFDQAVVGGGDKLIFAASTGIGEGWRAEAEGLFESTLAACAHCGHRNRAPRYRDAYLDWARRWDAAVRGRVGWVDRGVVSFYHGEPRNRRYEARRDILLRHDFDPRTDLVEDGGGCWSWTSAKPGLRLEVHNYFFERREDS